MRYAVLADIHSNLAAFQTVLTDVEQRGGVDEVWCLGDIVGYGPDPRECIALLKKVCGICVAGNHDLAAAGKLDISDFNPAATAANRWTAQQLTPEDIQYLSNLPLMIERGDFTLVHGSPHVPVREYLLSPQQAAENLGYFKTPYCLVGHSHLPVAFTFNKQGESVAIELLPESEITLSENRLIFNPGGIGQPRDGDPRASYAIYDSHRRAITLHRVPYDIPAVQARMREKGLPAMLINRLSFGM